MPESLTEQIPPAQCAENNLVDSRQATVSLIELSDQVRTQQEIQFLEYCARLLQEKVRALLESGIMMHLPSFSKEEVQSAAKNLEITYSPAIVRESAIRLLTLLDAMRLELSCTVLPDISFDEGPDLFEVEDWRLPQNREGKERLDVLMRWLISRDLPQVMEIEEACFEFPWTREDFMCCLRQRNCIGMVAEHCNEIVGFLVYELHKSGFHILNMGVAPDARRKNVGYQMVSNLLGKLHQQRREEIMLEVRERNVDAQLFFKAQGFREVSILRQHYDDTEEDAYLFSYKRPKEASAVKRVS